MNASTERKIDGRFVPDLLTEIALFQRPRRGMKSRKNRGSHSQNELFVLFIIRPIYRAGVN